MTSVNTLKSCSTRSVLDRGCIEDQVDFADIIIAAVNKFGCPISVDVIRNSLPSLDAHKRRKPERKTKMGQARTPMVSTIGSDSEASIPLEGHHETLDVDDSVLILNAVHNSKNRLVEISMNRYRYQQIPRVMMQVLGVILPSYTMLFKFTIQDCRIDKYTIPELKNILSITNITEVCLDSSFLPEGNYDIILIEATMLQNLSLQRCNINDEICKQIVSKLHYGKPAETKLLVLNLSSNHISDNGAKFIGEALRNNRRLRYLNLADNHITDDGARHIFNALKEFPLSKDDIFDYRRHRIKYLRDLLAVCKRCAVDMVNNSIYESKKSTKRHSLITSSRLPTKTVRSKVSIKTEKPSTSTSLLDESFTNSKTELIALDLIGPFDHPFQKSREVIKDANINNKGNFVLCYLNISYNHLMFPSLKRLLEVLEYQKIQRCNQLSGLLKVVLDGNNLPAECKELDEVKAIFGNITRTLTRKQSNTNISI